MSVPAVTSFEVAGASGLMGACAGYILAPRRYNLENLLTQDNEAFELAIPAKRLNKGTNEQKNAYNIIKSARVQLEKAVEANCFEAKLSEFLKLSKYETAYKNVKKLIPHARSESALLAGFLAGMTALGAKTFSNSKN